MADPVEASKATAKPQHVVAKPKRRRWLKRSFFLLALLGIFCWFAPTIVATPEVRNRLPKLLFPKYAGSIKFGEMSLGWASPVVIKNFHLEDEEGKVLLEFAELSTNETLWKLATRLGDFGTIRIVDPVIHVELSDSSSNLERTLAKLIAESTPNSLPVPSAAPDNSVSVLLSRTFASRFTVEVDNGRIELENQTLNRKAAIDSISVRLDSSRGVVDECDVAIGNPPTTGGQSTATDWLLARYGSQPDGGATSKSANDKIVVLKASHWKLDWLATVLPRLVSNADVGGEFNSDASVTLISTPTGIDWHWEGTISIERLIVAGIAALKRDRLALNQVEFSGHVASTQGRVATQDFKLTTDVCSFTATGDFPLDRHSQKSSLELVQSLLSDEDYHIDGRVDLKKLAALLPQTLRIREGTEITSGDVKVQFVGVAVDGVRRWSGVAGIVGLNGVNQGKKIPWDKPIAARVNAHRDHDAIVVDLLECKSEFLQVSGKGTLDDARFTASGDLSKLLVNVERFVDLGIQELSGQMKASGELRRKDADHVELTSKIMLDDFAYVISKNSVWHEQHLELSINAAGQTDSKPTLMNVGTGEAHLKSGADTLDVVLQKPIDMKSSMPSYSAIANLTGSLMSWQNRLRPFISVNDWQLAGDVTLATNLSMDAEHVDVSQLTAKLQKLEATGLEWLIEDPEVTLQTAGRWNTKAQKWTSPKINLIGKALTVEVADLECALGPQGLNGLAGTASYRADLKQISSWKNLAVSNPSYYLLGSLSGTAGITRQNGGFVGNVNAQVDKLIVAGQGTGTNGQPQWVALWKEPQFKFSGSGSYDGAADKLILDSSHVDADGLSIGANGKLDNCLTNRRIDLSGDLAYDWDRLMKRMGPQLSQQIQMTGKDHRPFSLKGSLVAASNGSTSGQLVPAASVSFQPDSNSKADANSTKALGGLFDLCGEAGLGWSTAKLYGFTAGTGDLSTQIDHGVCRFVPLDLMVNDGKLHVTPTIYLDRDPIILVLPQEKVIDQLSITPALCSNSLKFVAPMLADSTQIDGKISIDLQAASMPLVALTTGTADGLLTIHRAQAKPGPTSLQITDAINQVQSILTRKQATELNRDQIWIEMAEQQVPFKLDRGRVYHQGMTFVVKNVAVKTSGSVGIDNTLSLIAEIAISDDWLGNNKALGGLKGKTIRIPIAGTTSRPQIDPGVFADLARQIGGAAIDGLLEDNVGNGLKGVLNNGLDQLLRGKK